MSPLPLFLFSSLSMSITLIPHKNSVTTIDDNHLFTLFHSFDHRLDLPVSNLEELSDPLILYLETLLNFSILRYESLIASILSIIRQSK